MGENLLNDNEKEGHTWLVTLTYLHIEITKQPLVFVRLATVKQLCRESYVQLHKIYTVRTIGPR